MNGVQHCKPGNSRDSTLVIACDGLYMAYSIEEVNTVEVIAISDMAY